MRCKRFFANILILVVVMLTACSNTEPVANKPLDAVYEGLYVDGTKLLNSDGSEVIMRGVNIAHCWYKDYDDVSLAAIKEKGANTVRVVLSNGARWDKDSSEEVAAIIEKAAALDLLTILEVHDGTGVNDIETLQDIADYWCELAPVLEGTEDHVIVNIANEWCKSYLSSKWAHGYTKVIPTIREAGIKNVIMVDAGGYGQYGGSIKKRGVEVYESDELCNTMFSIHMYGISGRSQRTITKNLKGVTDLNLCVAVGEFGYTHSDGNVDEEFLMKYCTENSIGFIPWSWKGNSGGVEYLDLAIEWDGSALSDDWGEPLFNSPYWLLNSKN